MESYFTNLDFPLKFSRISLPKSYTFWGTFKSSEVASKYDQIKYQPKKLWEIPRGQESDVFQPLLPVLCDAKETLKRVGLFECHVDIRKIYVKILDPTLRFLVARFNFRELLDLNLRGVVKSSNLNL